MHAKTYMRSSECMHAQNSTLAPNETVAFGGVLVGTSPENFYPMKITLDGMPCRTQQD